MELLKKIYYENKEIDSASSIPKALEPYINKYGDSVDEFKKKYCELEKYSK